jgi:hypothetical protein
MAAGIKNAKFVPLDTRNHMLVPNEPAHQAMVKAIAEFLGEKPIRTSGVSDRLEHRARALEQHWSIKFVLIFAAITGCFIFFWEIYKLVRGGAH